MSTRTVVECSPGLFSYGEGRKAAGSNTFYFLAREVGGNCAVFDMQLTCLYIPTSYGVISETLASGDAVEDDQTPQTGGPTASYLAREIVESQAANQARIDAELAAVREEVEKLKEELRRERQE